MKKFWRRNKDTDIASTEATDTVESEEAKISLPGEPQRVAYRRLWKVALAAGMMATIVNALVYYGVQISFGVSFAMPVTLDASEMVEMSVGWVMLVSFLPALGAALLLAFLGIPFLGRRLPPLSKVFWGIAGFFLFFSLVGPWGLPAVVLTSTKLALSVMHMLAAFIIVSILLLFGRKK